MLQAKTIDLKNKILNFVNSNLPIKSGDRELTFEDISITEPKELNDIEAQLKMKNEKQGSLKGYLKAKVVIKDSKTGKKITQSRQMDLIPIYYLTERNTYFINGVEKNILSQMKLSPGVYTEKLFNNNNNVKTNMIFDNSRKTTKYMPPLEVTFDPIKMDFKIHVKKGAKDTSFNGINFLREIGFNDSEIAKMIGNNNISDTLFSISKNQKSIKDIYYAITSESSNDTPDKLRLKLYDFMLQNAVFGSGQDVNKATIGINAVHLTKDVISKSVEKTFAVARNDVEQDDKDDLRFKPVFDDNDLILDSLEKDFDAFKKNIQDILKNNKNIKFTDVKTVTNIGSSIDKFMTQSALVQSTEQINPLFMAAIGNKVTQLGGTGSGGMSSQTAMTSRKPRNLKVMAINRLDPVETPESTNIGLIEHLSQSAKIRNKTVYVPMLKIKNGVALDTDANTVELSPSEEYDVKVAFFDSRYVKKDGNKITFIKDKVPARYQGKIVELHVKDIQYVDKAAQNLFNYSANMIPYLAHNDGNRALMGTNMQKQAILLRNREAPLVTTSVNGGNKTYEELIGEEYGKPVRSQVSGVITKINQSSITIKGEDGKEIDHQYYNYFPLNQSFINNDVTVKVGDAIKKGDMIAEGWQTKDGKLALGLNARIGYLPYKGYNYEDGIVVSNNFAKKMATEEMDEKDCEIKADWIGGRGSNAREEFKKYTTNQEVYTRLDKDGIIKVGQYVRPGDIIVGYLRPEKQTETYTLSDLFGQAENTGNKYRYDSITIPSTSYMEGEVKRVDIVENPEPGIKQKVLVTLVNSKPLKLGDKVSGKHGNKGTITKILPDEEMPVAEDGKPLDLIFSPLAVPSRKNIGQLLEVGAGLVAEKKGKPIVVNNFDYTEKDKVIKGLKEIGFPDGKMKITLKEKRPDGTINEVVTDNPVTVGNMYIMKLKHKVDDKIQARSNLENSPETKTFMPAKTLGQEQGEKFNPQSLGEMEMRALQANSAVWNILESSTIKADGGGDSRRRVAIFKALSEGKFDALDYPATPETIKVLADTLKVLGLNMKPVNDGRPAKSFDDAFSGIALNPIKPTEMIKMIGKNNEVTKPFLYHAKADGKEDEAVEGGLIDPEIFGTRFSEDERRKWGYIKLATPLPNPVLFKSASYNPYSMLTGISTTKLDEMMDGKSVIIVDPEKYDFPERGRDRAFMVKFYKEHMEQAGLKPGDIINAVKFEEIQEEWGDILWKAGGEGLQHVLDNVDMENELNNTKENLKTLKGSALNKEYKKYKTLLNLKTNNMKPSDLMLHYVPVAPAYLRPVIKENKDYIYDNLNKLYENLIKSNTPIKLSVDNGFDMREDLNPIEAAKNTASLYKQVSNLFGKTTHIDPKKRKEVYGVINSLKDKEGLIRDKMLAKRVDFSGRSVIGVDPELNLNEAGIPADMARRVFRPFIFKELLDQGYAKDTDEAKKKWEKMDKDVKKVMEQIAEDRPIILNRQPTLHKFNVQAFKPVIKHTQDGENVRSIQLNPLVVTGFNADYDGDCHIHPIMVKYVNKDCIEKKVDNESGIRYNGINNSNKGDNFMPFVNTNIRYNYGLINLKDFPRKNLINSKENKEIYSVPQNIEVLTLWNGEKKWLPVENYSIHKNLNIIEITTNTSRTIHCSNDHSLVTVDNDLNYKRCAGENGITIPRLREPIEIKNNELLNYITLNNLKEFKYKFNTKINLDFNFGYFNGIYIGDGWVTEREQHKNAICLAADNNYIPDKIKEIIEGYMLCKENLCISCVPSYHDFKGYKSYCEKHTWHSSIFSQYLKDNIGHGAKNKHLPPYWVNTPEDFRWGLLSGLIDTDGSIAECSTKSKSKSQININFTTVSRNLAYEIVGLAHSLNLTASVTITQTPQGDECYTITFTQESVEIMKNNLMLNCPHKYENLMKFKPNPDYKRNKYTPKLCIERLKELRGLIGSPRITNRDGDVIAADIEKIKKRKSLYSVLYRVQKENTAITRQTALDIFELNLSIFEEDAFWAKWKNMVLDENIEWELVTNIKSIPFITEAYDLTIPPAYTMVTESGIVVYDSMAIHVPVTEKAKEEAKRLMMPSNNLINPTNGEMIIEIRHEMALGIYYLTMKYNMPQGQGKMFGSYIELRKAFKEGVIGARTKVSIGQYSNVTAGQAMFNLLIPEKLKQYRDFKKIWTNKEISNMLVNLYKECEKSNGKTISKIEISKIIDLIKLLGFEAATRSGISIGVTDFKKMEETEAIFRKYVEEEKKKNKDSEQALIQGWGKAEKEIQKKLGTGEVLGEDNPIQIMMTSGARAKPDQIRRMMVSVGVGVDVTNKLRGPVSHSHLDGLGPQEYWVHSYDSRKGMFDRSVATREPGTMSREVWSATQDIIIREKDCGSREGIDVNVNNATIRGRFVAETISGKDGIIAKYNDMITDEIRDKIFKSGLKTVKVRSPLKCKVVGGLCQKCYGTNPGTMQLPPLGTAVGVIASQAMGEPVTQMTMNTFHSGGTSSGATLGVERIRHILDLGKEKTNEAVLAKVSGKVTNITIGTKGTFDIVFINNTAHKIPHTDTGENVAIKVRVGDQVTKGDFLTYGDLDDMLAGDSLIINDRDPILFTSADPKDLFKLKRDAYDQDVALDFTQNYLTKSMEYAFDKTIGSGKIDSRHLETIVSKLTSKVKIIDPGDSNYTIAEVADKNLIDQWNATNAGPYSVQKIPISKSGKIIGRMAAESYKDKKGNMIINKGETFDKNNVPKLMMSNIKEVKVGIRPIKYDVELYSKDTVVTKGHDRWFSNLGHQNIFEQLARGATMGQTDPLEDPRSRLMAGKLLNIGEGFNQPKSKANTIAQKMYNLFSKE